MKRENFTSVLISALISALLTGIGGWLVVGRDVATRAEVEQMISRESPWLKDRGEVTTLIGKNAENIKKLEEGVRALIDIQQRLLVQQGILVTKIDQILKK